MSAGEEALTLEPIAVSAVIAFLNDSPIAQARLDHAVLASATREARRTGVHADEFLIKSGIVGERAFYRALAHHLDLKFVEKIEPAPLPALFDQGEIVRCANAGFVRLKASRQGHGGREAFALAPYGASLARIMTLDVGSRADLVMTTPAELLAGLRRSNIGRIRAKASGQDAASSALPSASHGVSLGQFGLAGLCAAVIPFSATLDFVNTVAILAILSGPLFLVLVILRLFACMPGSGITIAAGVAHAIPPAADRDLPIYSVIIPLYREKRVLPRLLNAIDGIDYPRAKLDVKIVVEADDIETRETLARLRRPAFVDVVVVPPGWPRTKPRALNTALLEARGELLTIYDAEDVPAPDQLRRAAAMFASCGRDIICLQAHLVIDNLADSWLSRCFAAEYAGLFDVLNPGLLRANLPILLGGTSNHFRTDDLVAIGGWDAWNVTEDADLAFRIARAGYRVAELDSPTLEEAPARLGLWMRQRSRWLKGYMQTVVTHSRAPIRLARQAGLGDAAVLMALSLGTVVSALGYPFFLAGTAAVLLGGHPDGALTMADALLDVLTTGLFCLGLIAMILPAVLGAGRRNAGGLWQVVPVLPIYYLLVSAAAWRAVFELIVAPFHWNKTEHGLARTSRYATLTGEGSPGREQIGSDLTEAPAIRARPLGVSAPG